MTTATQSKPVVIPASIREPATRLVADLAAVAGDKEAVLDALEPTFLSTSPDDRLAIAVAALVVVFSECITTPTDDNNNPVPVDWTTEGEQQ